MATRGLRVLAFARKACKDCHPRLGHQHVGSDLAFIGLQGVMDPPRLEVVQAIKECKEVGVWVKMITGDHALTASAVAREIGLTCTGNEPEAITAVQISRLTEEELIEVAAERSQVFARLHPGRN